MTYSEKLKDPRWQKKRLQILNRDKFKCKKCGDTETSLHVHHLKYEFNKEPWEYENKDLITLCNDCHKLFESFRKSADDFQSLVSNFKVFKTKLMEFRKDKIIIGRGIGGVGIILIDSDGNYLNGQVISDKDIKDLIKVLKNV